MKTKPSFFLAVIGLVGTLFQASADPQLTSWLTSPSGRYARLYTNAAMENSGVTVTTWSNGTESQSSPAYSGVQEIDSSSNWVYIHSTGLGFHVMGPWFLNAAKTQPFPNYPINTKTLTRIPRVPSARTTNVATGLGAIGCFVDGVAMYNSWDAYYWNGTTNASGGSSAGYYWRRDAYINEGVTFDAGNAHQDQSGTYHYHANPPALRYLLGDNVSYNSVSNVYTENQTNFHHSPILGWMDDGYPLYGPYGYSNATNANSGVRRMISGYVLRNGKNGTDDLGLTGRTSLPAWAGGAFGVSTNYTGPSTNGNRLDNYMEDNAYLGDLGKTQGVDFDLDEYNGRYCVTPDFPNGTYAYFVSIASNGAPVYPYNVGAAFYGNPTGGSTSISEAVTTNFLGGPNAPLQLSPPSVNTNNTVTLAWSAVEGGTYVIKSSTDLVTWTNKASGLTAGSNTATATFSTGGAAEYYAAVMTNLAAYDPVSGGTTGGGNGITSVSPTAYGRGTNFVLTINLSSAGNPPPASAPIISVSIGSNVGTSLTHVSQTEVQATFDLTGATGPQTVTVVFPGPPGDYSDYVSFTLPNGFTVN